MAIVAREFTGVIGVDTHARKHVLVALDPVTGARKGSRDFPTSSAGLVRALSWIHQVGGPTPLIAMEGTNSYGAIFARRLTADGLTVAEVEAPRRRGRKAKTDLLDAELAARQALTGEPLAEPRISNDLLDALDVLVTAHHQMTRERTRLVNQLTALLRRHDLEIDARARLDRRTITTISRWRNRTSLPAALAAIRSEAVRLATRITELDNDLKSNTGQLRKLLEHHPERIGHQPGIGTIVEADILTAWSHHNRITSHAAFAKLAGIAPIEASSGNTTRHRLDRHGDRRLNNAIWRIAFWRFHHDPNTHHYVQRRRTEGLSNTEIIRCLKRYIARSIWRQLQHPIDTTP